MSERIYRAVHSFLGWISALFFVIVVWLSIPSSLFISDAEMVIDGSRVEFFRLTPFGEIEARWRSEIVVHDDSNFECSSGKWVTSTYQVRPRNLVTYQIGKWAMPCLEREINYTMTTVLQVMLFGLIPLRPAVYVDTVVVDG